ncbi:MAG TPA: nucleotidyl transferase AbiEii/AbiGii toxin family protein [Bryobacteraceae bacterium]|nr:nucleotidyl transferase AbiEii/AbiGii toxin family protein [Bryobacteraceae bacterium]
MPSDSEPVTWHAEAIAPNAEAALAILRNASLAENFYLARGTGLALQFGHRLSRDLDFFASQAFDEDRLIQGMRGLPGFSLTAIAPQTLHATVQETKVSFLGYPYPALFPPAPYREVAVADPRDIACMKISAIAGRGARRDFVDLYVAAQRFGLAELLRLFDLKYAQIRYSKLHILKSLTFFEDAEKEPSPHLLVPLGWDEVKRFFLRDVPRLA